MGKRTRSRRRQTVALIALAVAAPLRTRSAAAMSPVSAKTPGDATTPTNAKAPDRTLNLQDYLSGTGAITVVRAGLVIDPYFSIKALLCGHRLGLQVDHLALPLLDWLVPRQQLDGTFSRYRSQGAEWHAYAPADADDSMAAGVIELIALLAPVHGMSPQWAIAIERCQGLLTKLLSDRGTYDLSLTTPVQLLMDNCEVHQAIREYADCQRRRFRLLAAWQSYRKAQRLRTAIVDQFWQPDQRRYRISSQPRSADAFYPDATAQWFPRLCGLNDHIGIPIVELAPWLQRYGDGWLAGASDHYPWGLMAMAMRLAGRADLVARWLSLAAGLRDSARWNVLEEAIYQGLLDR